MKTFTESSGTFSWRTFPSTTQVDLSSQLDLLVLQGKEELQCLCLPHFSLQQHLARTNSRTPLSSEQVDYSGREFCCQTLGRQGRLQVPGACAMLRRDYLSPRWCTHSQSLRFCLDRSAFDIIHSNEFIREKEEAAELDIQTLLCPSVSEKYLVIYLFL